MGIDPYAENLARLKAWQLIRRPEFTRSDREDIEQEILLDVLERLPDYDPKRASRRTFISRIIDHKVASLLEFRSAARRDPRRVECALNTPVAGDDGQAELGSLIEGTNPRPAHVSDLAMDLDELLRTLPSKLRAVCELLPRSTVKEIAAEFGVSRRTVHRWKTEIQRRCEDMDLDQYL